MKYLTEKIVLGIVVLVLGYIFLHNVSGSDHIIHYIYNYASYGYMVLIFVFMGLQWIGDPAQTWKKHKTLESIGSHHWRWMVYHHGELWHLRTTPHRESNAMVEYISPILP